MTWRSRTTSLIMSLASKTASKAQLSLELCSRWANYCPAFELCYPLIRPLSVRALKYMYKFEKHVILVYLEILSRKR